MSKQKHIHAVIAHIKVAVAYHPDDNLLLLTTQIKEQARKLTGFIECSTTLGKIPAPPEKPAVVVIDPIVDLTPPVFLQGSAKQR